MAGQKVFRKESTRWVAPKTSYDGDDWGNGEFIEEDPYENLENQDLNVNETNFNPVDTNLKSISEDARHSTPLKLKHNTTETNAPEAVKPEQSDFPSLNGDSSLTKAVKYATIEPKNEILPEFSPSNKAEQADEDEESSIQDIYGFYENRYSTHPYSANSNETQGHGTNNEFSDSSASLSTGIDSVDSGAQESHRSEVRGSSDYQPGLGKVPESTQETDQIIPGSIAQLNRGISQLHICKHSRDVSPENLTSSSAQQNVEASHHDRPDSKIVDCDIAELYQGSSKFLNRPISTYNPVHQRESSDQSIKNLLTPQFEQSEFEFPESSKQATLPQLSITSASSNDDNPGEYEAAAPETESRRSSAADSVLSAPKDFATDHEYFDEPSDLEGSSSTDDQLAQDRNSEDDVGLLISAAEAAKTPYYSSDMPTISSGNKSVSEHFLLPSERIRLHGINTVFKTMLDDNPDHQNVKDHITDARSKMSHQQHSSVSSNATGVTSLVNPTDVADDDMRSFDQCDTFNGALTATLGPFSSGFSPDSGSDSKDSCKEEESLGSSTRVPQSIASKVRRPPQIDFSALLNKLSTSSETRCEQMRILRAREAEYSTGLETWLMATLDQADKGMKIFVNGIPPAAPEGSTALDLPKTAKVSNAMHSSATNTKEKLGKVSEKSKSFFAKVIR